MKRAFVVAILLSLTASESFGQTPPAAPRKRDSVWQGALIGGAAGVAGTVIFVRQNCGPPGFDRECEVRAWPLGVAIFIPAGIVTGVLIDRAIGNQRIIVAPIVGKNGAALSITLKRR